MRAVVEQVIQTATKVVDGGLAAREAFTVLLALGRELRRREQTSDEPRHVRAVTDDLARVLDALG